MFIIDNILVLFEEPEVLDIGPVVDVPIAEVLEGVSLHKYHCVIITYKFITFKNLTKINLLDQLFKKKFR